MSNARTVQQILKCDTDTAEKIVAVMYEYISPDWSEASTASLRADLRMVAEYAKIKIVPAPKATKQ